MKRTQNNSFNSLYSKLDKPRKASQHKIQQHYLEVPCTLTFPTNNSFTSENNLNKSNQQLHEEINKLRDKIYAQNDQIKILVKKNNEIMEQNTYLKQQNINLRSKLNQINPQKEHKYYDVQKFRKKGRSLKNQPRNEKNQLKINNKLDQYPQQSQFKVQLKKIQQRIIILQQQKNIPTDKMYVDKILIYNMLRIIRDLNKKLHNQQNRRTPSRTRSGILQKFQKSSNLIQQKRTVKKNTRGQIISSYYA